MGARNHHFILKVLLLIISFFHMSAGFLPNPVLPCRLAACVVNHQEGFHAQTQTSGSPSLQSLFIDMRRIVGVYDVRLLNVNEYRDFFVSSSMGKDIAIKAETKMRREKIDFPRHRMLSRLFTLNKARARNKTNNYQRMSTVVGIENVSKVMIGLRHHIKAMDDFDRFFPDMSAGQRAQIAAVDMVIQKHMLLSAAGSIFGFLPALVFSSQLPAFLAVGLDAPGFINLSSKQFLSGRVLHTWINLKRQLRNWNLFYKESQKLAARRKPGTWAFLSSSYSMDAKLLQRLQVSGLNSVVAKDLKKQLLLDMQEGKKAQTGIEKETPILYTDLLLMINSSGQPELTLLSHSLAPRDQGPMLPLPNFDLPFAWKIPQLTMQLHTTEGGR